MIFKYIIYISFAYYYQVCYSDVHINKGKKQTEIIKNSSVNVVPIAFKNSTSEDTDGGNYVVVYGSKLSLNVNESRDVTDGYRVSNDRDPQRVLPNRYQILRNYLKDFVVENVTDRLNGIKDGSLSSDAILQYLFKARNLVTEDDDHKFNGERFRDYNKLTSSQESQYDAFIQNCKELFNISTCESCDFPDVQNNSAENRTNLIGKINGSSFNSYLENVSCWNLLLSASNGSLRLNRRLSNQDSHYYVALSVGQWIRVSAYVVIFVLGVVGNSLVVATLLYHRNMRTITNIFLLNLAVSDLLLGVFCMPFTLVGSLLREFIFGGAMCKLVPYMQAVSISVSVWTLVAISLERYYAICKPLSSRQWQTMKHASQVVAVVWISSTILMLPIAILSELVTFGEVKGSIRYKCREKWPSMTSERTFNVLLSSYLLLVPLIIMGVAYMKVVKCLSRGMSLERRQVLDYPENAKVNCNNGLDSTKLSVRFKKFPKNRVYTAEPENELESSDSCVSAREGLPKSKSEDLILTDTDFVLNEGKDKTKYLAEILSPVQEGLAKVDEPRRKARYFSLKSLRNPLKKSHRRQESETSFVDRNSGYNSEDRSAETEEGDRTSERLRWRRKTNSSESSHMSLRPIRSTHLRQSLISKQRVIRMLFVLVAEFFICWTPLFLVTNLALWVPFKIYGLLGNVGISLIQLLAYASSCCNPITYCFMNATFFQSFKQAFSYKERRASRRLKSQFQSSLRGVPNIEVSVLPSNKPSNNISRKNALGLTP